MLFFVSTSYVSSQSKVKNTCCPPNYSCVSYTLMISARPFFSICGNICMPCIEKSNIISLRFVSSSIITSLYCTSVPLSFGVSKVYLLASPSGGVSKAYAFYSLQLWVVLIHPTYPFSIYEYEERPALHLGPIWASVPLSSKNVQ